MSILNVNQIQPVGSGQTVTISAANITASSSTITANTFSGSLSSSGVSTFSDTVNVGAGKSIRLYGASSGYSDIIAAAGSASTTFTLPANGGSNGQYLQTNGSGTLSFAGVGGTILNTYTATDTAGRTTTSETFTAASNTASVTLTPASADSKFLIFLTTTMGCSDGNDGWILTLFRDTTNLAADAVDGFLQGNSVPGVTHLTYPVAIAHLDSPNTTSQIVYQPQFRVIDYDSDGGSARIGYTANGSSGGPAIVLTVLEIGG